MLVAVPVLWTAMEWLQGHLGDLSFPWLGLGTALAGFPRFAGAADLVGARGLSFWVALVNALVAGMVLALRAGRPVGRLVTTTLLAVALPAGYGFWRAATLELRPAATIAVVQPNIPEELKMQRQAAVDSSLTALTHLTLRVPRDAVDLIVWPEVAIPAILESPFESHLQEPVRQLSGLVGAPILVGAYGMRERGRQRPILYNSAFLATGTGLTGEVYHKRHLVPFVERIPFVDPAALETILGRLDYFGGLGSGDDAPLFRLGGGRFGVLICYESIFASQSRAFRLGGGDYLVNMTNDAWYGREPWYTRTSALWQHPAHLVMRAVELRIGIARSANTGISMFVDPLGRTSERTALFEPDVRVGTVYTTDGLTLYARWGDWLATASAMAAVLLLLTARLLGGRASGRAGSGVAARSDERVGTS